MSTKKKLTIADYKKIAKQSEKEFDAMINLDEIITVGINKASKSGMSWVTIIGILENTKMNISIQISNNVRQKRMTALKSKMMADLGGMNQLKRRMSNITTRI